MNYDLRIYIYAGVFTQAPHVRTVVSPRTLIHSPPTTGKLVRSANLDGSALSILKEV